MSRQIWNEGRVVGLSAYELYVRHTLSEFGTEEPVLTEREWLASTLGDGVSLILKLNSGLEKGVHSFMLPQNSTLCSATGAITASLFNGTADTDDYGWGKVITSYGPLLQDTTGSYIDDVADLDNWDKQNLHTIRDFLKIVDGVVFHNNLPEDGLNFKPDLNSRPTLRLRLSEQLTTDVYVLLTGFMQKSIVKGLYKVDSDPLASPKPQNGDFLGPEVYPWGTKVIFSVHSEVYELISRYSYTRQLPHDSTVEDVEARAIVDFETTDPLDYYKAHPEKDEVTGQEHIHSSVVSIKVNDLNIVDDKGANVLAVYQKDSQNRYPAGLYGAKVRDVTSEGTTQPLCPIDIVAPGSVKVFKDKDLAMNYTLVYPNLYSLYMDVENEDMYLIDKETADSGQLPAPIGPKIQTINEGTEASPKYIARTYKGNTDEPTEEIKAISMYNTEGELLNTEGTQGDISNKDKLDWTLLLAALGGDKKVDLLGRDLRSIREDTLKREGDKLMASVPVQSPQYIEFKTAGGQTLRLYISSTAPSTAGVPIGSIGIGWTE